MPKSVLFLSSVTQLISITNSLFLTIYRKSKFRLRLIGKTENIFPTRITNYQSSLVHQESNIELLWNQLQDRPWHENSSYIGNNIFQHLLRTLQYLLSDVDQVERATKATNLRSHADSERKKLRKTCSISIH